jgi:hypothetical protein
MDLNELIAAADKLRPLHDDDPKKEPLTHIVDQINAIRAEEAEAVMRGEPPAADAAPLPDLPSPKRK